MNVAVKIVATKRPISRSARLSVQRKLAAQYKRNNPVWGLSLALESVEDFLNEVNDDFEERVTALENWRYS